MSRLKELNESLELVEEVLAESTFTKILMTIFKEVGSMIIGYFFGWVAAVGVSFFASFYEKKKVKEAIDLIQSNEKALAKLLSAVPLAIKTFEKYSAIKPGEDKKKMIGEDSDVLKMDKILAEVEALAGTKRKYNQIACAIIITPHVPGMPPKVVQQAYDMGVQQ